MRTKPDWRCCDKYNGELVEVILQPKGGSLAPVPRNYSKQTCAHCGHFIRWSCNPKTLQMIEDRKALIAKLEPYKEKMTPKAKKFIEGIKDNRFISPHQHHYLLSLKDKFLGNLGCPPPIPCWNGPPIKN
jgi:hypothetical protein